MGRRDTSLVEKALSRSPGHRDRPVDNTPSKPVQPAFLGHFRIDTVRELDLDEDHAFEHRLICGRQDPGTISAYKLMRTRVLQLLKLNNWHSIAIAGMRKGDGKSLTSINLALSLARHPNQTVVLVDLDLRNPSIARYLGFQNSANLMDVVRGDMPLQDGLVKVANHQLYVLANDEKITNSSELLTSESMIALARTLNGIDGTIIYDLPPLFAADDFLAFSLMVDCVLLVVAEGRTLRRDLMRACEALDKVNLLGAVMNDSSDSIEGYY